MKIISILIVAFVVILLVAIAVVTIRIVKKDSNNFKNNKKNGVALIVGYGEGSDCEFTVKIPDVDDQHSYNLQGVYNVKKLNGQLDTSYPHFKIGDEVYVEYAPTKTLGLDLIEVHLRREMYDYPR